MHHDERSDQAYSLTNPGGMATSQTFPGRSPSTISPDRTQPGQGVAAMGDGAIACGHTGEFGPHSLMIVPFGQGDVGASFAMNLYCWRPTLGSFWGGKGSGARLWVPVLLASYNVTLGNQPGVLGADLGTGYLFASAVVQTFGATVLTGEIVDHWFTLSAPTGGIGMIVARVLGARFVETTFQLGNGCTGANALYAKL